MTFKSVIGTLALLFCFAAPAVAKDTELSSTKGISHYQQLVRLHPQKASYRNALGYYHLKAGNLGAAEKHFLKALELDSSYATAHNNLGIVYLHQGRPKQAEKEFRQALKLNPSYCKAQYNLAVALFDQKRYSKAAKAYLKAREMDSEYVERRDNREKMEEKMNQTLEELGEDDESTRKVKRLKQWFAPHY